MRIITFSEIEKDILDIQVDRRTDVWNWGKDNRHPSLIEHLTNHSVTAKSCIDKVAKAIYGKGVVNGSTIVNHKGQTLNDLVRTIARQYATHNNAFLSIQYNGLYEVISVEVINTTKVRVGKSDDEGYSGKYVVYNNWTKTQGRINPTEFQVIDRYNPNPKIIQKQIEAAGGINKYRGQILHIQKMFNDVYSLSDADAVMGDMVTEIKATEFKRQGVTTGFLGSKLMMLKPFATDEEREAFERKIKALRGAENANKLLVMEGDSSDVDLMNQMLIQDLTTEHNDTLFSESEISAEKNIIKSFNIPHVLVGSTESGLFGNSGELIKSAKDILWESREEERDKLEEALTSILGNFHTPIITEPLKIIKQHEENTTATGTQEL